MGLSLKEMVSWFHQWVERSLSVENLQVSVARLENIGKVTKACIRGYTQKGQLEKFHHFLQILSHIWFVTVIARSIRLLVVSDPDETLYLGDFFSTAQVKSFLHSIIIIYYLLFFSSRVGAHISEIRKPMLMLRFYERIKRNGFDGVHELLEPARDRSFRIYFYIALQFYFIGMPIINFSLFSLCAFFGFQNNIATQSIYHFVWFLFWILIITIPLAINVYTLFWYYTVNIILITYCSMSLTCVNDLGAKIESNVGKHHDLIKKYLKQQNKLLNLIRSANADIGPVVWVGYLISSFLANFTLFLGLFSDSGYAAMEIICMGLATTAYSNLTLLHFAGSSVHDRLMEIREKNFSIQARGINVIPSSIAVWINSTQERIENGEIGVSVGHIFVMRQSSFLFFVLENSGILMMFVANFKKS